MIPWRPLSFGRDFTAVHFARYYFLRLLPFPSVRILGSQLIASCSAGARRKNPDAAAKPAVQDAAARIERSGFSAMAPLITAAQIDESLAFLADKPAYAGDRRLFVTADPCDVPRASYAVETIVRCPHLLAVINNPDALAVAEAFLRCRPTVAAVGLHWSFPDASRVAVVQKFHRDFEAWRMLNLFVYLTDVDEEAGPHRYVLGSHRTRGRLRLSNYSEAQVHARYGSDSVHTVVGPRGTSFVENGWGIHEGHPPIGKRRLNLAVMYAAGPVPIYDYERVKVQQPHDHDRHVNRLLFA